MDRNKLQKKSRSVMLGTEGYDSTCFRIHIYKHRTHGNLHVSKKKAYQCASISLQRHSVKLSNLLDRLKELLVPGTGTAFTQEEKCLSSVSSQHARF